MFIKLLQLLFSLFLIIGVNTSSSASHFLEGTKNNTCIGSINHQKNLNIDIDCYDYVLPTSFCPPSPNDSYDTLNLTICDSIVSVTGKIFTSVGVYYDTIPNSLGFDSILVYNLSATFLSSSQIQKIVGGDRETFDRFGASVSISGTYAAIGAYLEDEDTSGTNVLYQAGSVYLFEKNSSGVWLEKQKLVASDRGTGDNFGSSVSISGNYLVVGAYQEDEDTLGTNNLISAGSAYVFERNVSGVWVEKQKLVASDRGAYDKFGFSVSISGNELIIGANQEDEDTSGLNTLSEAGSAYVFERNGSGVWVETQKLIASDRSADDNFGISVSISGKKIVIGAYQEDEDTSGLNTFNSAGSAYIFEKNSGGIWIETQKLVASDRGASDKFGREVSISDNYLVIGAPSDGEDASGSNFLSFAGSAYVFERNGNGIWIEAQKIVASDRNTFDYYGNSVSISGNFLVVGASQEDEDAFGMNTLSIAGSAYVFERNGNGIWIERQKIVASDRGSQDYFGISVSISGDNIFVGADGEEEDVFGMNTLAFAGSAYIFKLNFISSILDSTIVFACDSFVSHNGDVLKTSGVYYDTTTTSSGCDSIMKFDITINNSVVMPTVFLTDCDSSQINGTWYYSTQIIHDTLMTVNNCDSIVNTDLTINNSVVMPTVFLTDCDSSQVNGVWYFSTQTVRDTLMTSNNCDSIINTDLTINNSVIMPTVFLTDCDSSQINGVWYYLTQTLRDTLKTSKNCDSIINTDLTINNSVVMPTVFLTDCDSSQVNGVWYSSTQIIRDTLKTSNNCDSIVNTDLTINNSVVMPTVFLTDCDSSQINGVWYFSTQTVRDTLMTSNNCDSIINTGLTINNSDVMPTIFLTDCDSSQINGTWYYLTQIIRDTLMTSNNCDSIVNTDLTINNSVVMPTVIETACDSSQVNGVWYYSTQTVRDTLKTSKNCDSIVNTDLTINNSVVMPTVFLTDCDSSQINGVWYYSTQTVRDTFMTINNCDSIVVINVTIKLVVDTTILDTICMNQSYTLPKGGIVFVSGIYRDTLFSSSVTGCDSVIITDLTVKNISTSIQTIASCDSIISSTGKVYKTSGNYVDTLVNSIGCDSLITTNFTLNSSYSLISPISICVGDSVIIGSNTYSTAGTYRDSLQTKAGCDSIIITVVSVNPLISSRIDSVNDICEDATTINITATPFGGTWGGTGINAGTGEFDPMIAGSGTHIITYTPNGTCPEIDSFSITVFPSPVINYGANNEECDKSDGSINVNITNGTPSYTYSWSDGSILADLIGIKKGTYLVTVTDSKNCKATETISILNETTPECEYVAYVANIFSPDGNGENDILYVQGTGIETLTYKIYNRWGELVFESTNKNFGWNGEYEGDEVTPGAFVYFIQGTFINGKTFNQKGTVTIVR